MGGSVGVPSPRTRGRVAVATAGLAGVLALGLGSGLAAPGLPASDAASAGAAPTRVVLVTLEGPGTAGYLGPLARSTYRSLLTSLQDRSLARIDAEPLYRWTTALNGYAAALTPEQVEVLRADDDVVRVEVDAVRPLAAARTVPATAALSAPASAGRPVRRGGAGQVIGVVDTGLWPDSPVFAPVPGLGREPVRFRGGCDADDSDLCTGKVVGARWFVAGFGADRVRSSSSLSARDDHGHGTQVASVAAGNAGVSVDAPGLPGRTFGGVAPQARVAAYKACWTAPDPDDDGCSAADLVAAVDRAVRDRVDVLTVAVGGGEPGDTLERALLGAAEAGTVVVGAAGNDGRTGYAAHSSPWVTTVGAAAGAPRTGRLVLPGGPAPAGAMAATRGVRDVRLVTGAAAAAPGVEARAARQCRPGSLDAARVRGAVVVCERGGVARVAKSDAVDRAGGAAMVLLNVRPGSVVADLHRVPTVHLRQAAGEALRRWSRTHPRGRVSLAPVARGDGAGGVRVPAWSEPGDPGGAVLKPDLVAPGTGVLAATPPAVRGLRWDLVSGTSVATAHVAGLAARLLAAHDWSAAEVRSALVTTAAPAAASALRAGAGVPRGDLADRPGLGFPVRRGAYRAWFDDFLPDLNTPSVLLSAGDGAAVRTLVNLGRSRTTWTGSATGFTSHAVTVSPAAFTLAPGERVRVRIRVAHASSAHPEDDGAVVWTGSDGSVVRVPVALVR